MAVINPARILSRKSHVLPGRLHVTELFFAVPLDYAALEGPKVKGIKLFGRLATRHESPIVSPSGEDAVTTSTEPICVYLEGGPGFGNREPQESSITLFLVNRGYQVLFLDYRGTGLSTPVNAETVTRLGTAEDQADYLKKFRADNIVRDLEAVRSALTNKWPAERKQWSTFGQSFGGFVTFTYLSKHPEGLRECFITGGLAPLNRMPEEVYRHTFEKVIERNKAYYKKYPEDVENVRLVVNYIHKMGPPELPNGGKLTVERLLSMGIDFGFHGGLDTVHSTILRLVTDLDQFNQFTKKTLSMVDQASGFESNPIYAVLHEAIYCFHRFARSNWAAYRVGLEYAAKMCNFAWLAGEQELAHFSPCELKEPFYFTGEMVFPHHFESHPELAALQPAASLLADCANWGEDSELYNEEQLQRNPVPVYAVSYLDDMYVHWELARETAKRVKNVRVAETNMRYHNALRSCPDEILNLLFKLRDDTID